MYKPVAELRQKSVKKCRAKKCAVLAQILHYILMFQMVQRRIKLFTYRRWYHPTTRLAA